MNIVEMINNLGIVNVIVKPKVDTHVDYMYLKQNITPISLVSNPIIDFDIEPIINLDSDPIINLDSEPMSRVEKYPEYKYSITPHLERIDWITHTIELSDGYDIRTSIFNHMMTNILDKLLEISTKIEDFEGDDYRKFILKYLNSSNKCAKDGRFGPCNFIILSKENKDKFDQRSAVSKYVLSNTSFEDNSYNFIVSKNIGDTIIFGRKSNDIVEPGLKLIIDENSLNNNGPYEIDDKWFVDINYIVDTVGEDFESYYSKFNIIK